VVTRDPKIKIFHMPEDEADINGDDWSELDLQVCICLLRAASLVCCLQSCLRKHVSRIPGSQHEVSLLSSVKVRKGRQVVALATGYIHPYDSKTARTQVCKLAV